MRSFQHNHQSGTLFYLMSISSICQGVPDVDDTGQAIETDLHSVPVSCRQSWPGHIIGELRYTRNEDNRYPETTMAVWTAKAASSANKLTLEALQMQRMDGDLQQICRRWDLPNRIATYSICVGRVLGHPFVLDSYPASFKVVAVETSENIRGVKTDSLV